MTARLSHAVWLTVSPETTPDALRTALDLARGSHRPGTRPEALVIDDAHHLPASSRLLLQRWNEHTTHRVRVVLLEPPGAPGPRAEPPASAEAANGTTIRLTRREQEVLVLLGSGATYRDIAELLWLSVNTVKTHVSSLYAKLDVKNRSDALALARTLGLLDPDEG